MARGNVPSIQRHARGFALLKSLATKALVKSRVVRLASSVRAPAAVFLSYHSIRDEPEHGEWISPGITHSTRIFSRHMEIMASQFHPVSIDEVISFLGGSAPLPRYAVVVTFDDGFFDNVEVALPILTRLGIPAVFYLTAGLIGTREAPWYSRLWRAFKITKRNRWKPHGEGDGLDISNLALRDVALRRAYEQCAPLVGEAQKGAVMDIEQELGMDSGLPNHPVMMSWDQVKLLARNGYSVGSHTLSHPNLAFVQDGEQLRDELVISKQRIEQCLATPVKHFSYPHPALDPQWNERTVAATKEAGYSSAVTTTRGPVAAGTSPFVLKRLNSRRTEHEFIWNLERAFLQA